jgi:hypothetical protein
MGVYGAEGYFLAAFDAVDKHLEKLPSWVKSVAQVFGGTANGPWLDPPPANDTRALQDPRNSSGPRKIGQYCGVSTQPSFPIDITVEPAAPGFTYQFAVYLVDWDGRGRRQTVQLMDGDTKEDISPAVLVGPDFVGGVWLVWQYPSSVRVRVNLIRGTNEVFSAVLFDLVKVGAGGSA